MVEIPETLDPTLAQLLGLESEVALNDAFDLQSYMRSKCPELAYRCRSQDDLATEGPERLTHFRSAALPLGDMLRMSPLEAGFRHDIVGNRQPIRQPCRKPAGKVADVAARTPRNDPPARPAMSAT